MLEACSVRWAQYTAEKDPGLVDDSFMCNALMRLMEHLSYELMAFAPSQLLSCTSTEGWGRHAGIWYPFALELASKALVFACDDDAYCGVISVNDSEIYMPWRVAYDYPAMREAATVLRTDLLRHRMDPRFTRKLHHWGLV